MADAACIAEIITSRHYRWANEDDLQRGIASVFDDHGVAYEREVSLNVRDRVDFMVGDLAIEVKIACSQWAIIQQLARYASHDRVAALLLVTSSLRLHSPALVGDKPVHVVRIPLWRVV